MSNCLQMTSGWPQSINTDSTGRQRRRSSQVGRQKDRQTRQKAQSGVRRRRPHSASATKRPRGAMHAVKTSWNWLLFFPCSRRRCWIASPSHGHIRAFLNERCRGRRGGGRGGARARRGKPVRRKNAAGKTRGSFMDKTPAKGPLLAQRNNKQTSQQQIKKIYTRLTK